MTNYNSPPMNHRQLLVGLILIGYGIFLGEIYSYLYFSLWLVTHILVIGLILTLLWPALWNRVWPTTPLDAALLGLGLIMVLSALLSGWPRLALGGVFLWLSQVLIFYLIVRLMRQGWADSFLRALILVTGVVLLVGLFELGVWYFGLPFLPGFTQGWWELGGVTQPIPPTWHRLNFTLTNPVVLSAYLVTLVPLGVTYLFTSHRPADLMVVTLFVVISFVILIFTFSRSGLIGVGIGLGTLTGLWVWQRSQRLLPGQRLRLLITWGSGLGLLAASLAYIVWIMGRQRLTGDAIRLALWQAALYLYQHNPLLGVGPGLFRWSWRFSPVAPQIEDRYVTAHNLYLHHLAELGSLGGLAGLWLLIVLGIVAWKSLPNAATTRQWWRQAGCIAGLVGFLGQGFFETFSAWPNALPVILLTAYLMAPYSGANQRFTSLSRLAGPLLAVIWLFGAIAVTYFAWPRYLVEQARTLPEKQEAIAALKQSISLDPGLALYQFELADHLARLNPPDFQKARTIYQNAFHLESTYSLNHANLAAIEWSLGNHTTALEQIDIATQQAPHNAQFWLTQGFYAEETGDADQALWSYAQAISRQPNWISSNFWQATPWRSQNFAAILTQTQQNLPPLEADRLNFEFQLQANNFSQAQAVLNQLREHDETGYVYNLSGGKLYLARQELSQALTYAEQAIQLEPAISEGFTLKAKILFELGQLDSALQSAKYAIFLDPGSADAYFIIGKIREVQGLERQAEAAYWRGYTSPLYSLDYSMAIYQQLASLLPLPLLPQINAGPHAAKSWLALAHLYQKQGRWQEAGHIYARLLQDDPFLESARAEWAELCQQSQIECPQPLSIGP